jgi:predicted NUDIX family NTP pyrophosphohydrolase
MARQPQISAGLLAFRLRPEPASLAPGARGRAGDTDIFPGKLVATLPESTGVLDVLLAHPGGPFWAKRDAGAWTIPKGLVETGADLLTTARREFTEETGFTVAGDFIPLHPVKQKSGKVVHAFAVEADFVPEAFTGNLFDMEWPPKSGRWQRFPEIDRLAWLAVPEARTKLIAYQHPFLTELQQILGGRRAGFP